MNIQQVPEWKVNFLKNGCVALRTGVQECMNYLKKACTKVQVVDKEIAKAIESLSAEDVCLIRHLLENYRALTEKQLKEIQNNTKEGKSILKKTQARKEALLDAECGTLDYGIEEKIGIKMEGVEISTSESEHKENTGKEKFDKEEAEGSLTQLIKRSGKQNLETEKLGTYRNIFAGSEAEVQQQLQVVAQDVSSKDRNLEKWLGLSNQVFA